MKKLIFGVGFILSGSVGVALGNMEKTIFYTSPRTDIYVHSTTYYIFIVFLILGIIFSILGLIEKRKIDKHHY